MSELLPFRSGNVLLFSVGEAPNLIALDMLGHDAANVPIVIASTKGHIFEGMNKLSRERRAQILGMMGGSRTMHDQGDRPVG